MKYPFCLFTFFLFAGLQVKSQTITFTQTILFKNNQSAIQPEYQDSLFRLKCHIQGRKIEEIIIAGYADNTGPENENELLSKSRAIVIKTWLENNIPGINNTPNFKTNFFGEKQPLNNNADTFEKALNRRVLLIIKVNYTPYKTIPELNKITATGMQEFCIDNNRDTLLVAKQGTMVLIKANSFLKSTDSCTCITIQIKEANILSDILKNNLTTINDTNILFSQSMVFVNAKCKTGNLQLANDKDYVVFCPTTENVIDADLYRGELDSLENINWKGLGPLAIDRIAAASFVKCNGSRSGFRDKVISDSCIKMHYFFKGFLKTIYWSFQSGGAAKKHNYRNCRRMFREQKKADEINAKRINKDLNQTAINPKKEIGCIISEMGPCGEIINKYSLDCSVNYEKKVKNAIDSLMKNGKLLNIENINQLQFAVFSRKQLGWSNIDWMFKVPDNKKETIRFDLVASPHTNVKIIFNNYKTILQAIPDENGQLALNAIPVDEPATLLITDTRTGMNHILAQKLKIITGKKTILPEFKALDLNAYIRLMDSFDK